MRTVVVVMGAGLMTGAFAVVHGLAAGAQQTSAASASASASIPQKPEEHFALEESYRAKAASYRAEAEEHRKMFADYERRTASPLLKVKTGWEEPWVKKMRKHCDGYIKEATRLAADADSFAAFHRMRGMEAAPAPVAPQTPAAAAPSSPMSVPETPDQHAVRAAGYKQRAAAYRQEAQAHRKMLGDYVRKNGNPALQSKTGRELPWVANMRKHCEAYVKQAEKMAAEADQFAEFHRLLGEEAKGK
jgi:hypothetical protein